MLICCRIGSRKKPWHQAPRGRFCFAGARRIRRKTSGTTRPACRSGPYAKWTDGSDNQRERAKLGTAFVHDLCTAREGRLHYRLILQINSGGERGSYIATKNGASSRNTLSHTLMVGGQRNSANSGSGQVRIPFTPEGTRRFSKTYLTHPPWALGSRHQPFNSSSLASIHARRHASQPQPPSQHTGQSSVQRHG